MDLITEALVEERAQRAVCEAGNQRSFGAGAAFTAEEGTGDTSAGIHAFFVVNSQREEILSFSQAAHSGGGKNNGITLA